MKKIKYLFFTLSILGVQAAIGQPELSSWILNNNGATGFNGIPSNIQKLQYSADYIYVSASCIPGYDIGPWKANPNTASNQNFVFKITRKPTKNTGTASKVGLGHVGIWSNGVSIYNASDGMSYNNAGVWNRNAYFFEGVSFDNCLGHPAQNGEYHHHVSPKCLYNSIDSSKHSPIIGYAWDGFPIYGAYAYTNIDGTGKIKRMNSGYKVKSMVTRTNGPNPDQTYPLGCFMEDYEFVSGYGDLDEHNGRYCVTPEYPNGIYAYFVTIDKDQTPVFPYVMYNSYYGFVTPGNQGPGSGHVTISEAVSTYNPSSNTELINENSTKVDIFPNPSKGLLNVFISNTNANNYDLIVRNSMGQIIKSQSNLQPTVNYTISMENQAPGIYFAELSLSGKRIDIEKILIQR